LDNRADALPCGIDGSLGGLSEQRFELCEYLLDRIEVRGKKSLAPTARMARRAVLPL
jgi:hypothetical protein